MGNTVTLHSACAYGDLGSVRRLLKAATPEQLEGKDDSGRTPLLVAIAAMKLGEELDEDDEFADLDEFESEHDADQSGSAPGGNDGADGATELAEAQATDGVEEEGEDAEGESKAGRETTGQLEGSEPEEVEEFTEDSMVELLSKQAEILHLLLKKHVDVHHRDENGWTALHHACFVQSAVAVRMLVHAGAKPSRNNYGLLPQVCGVPLVPTRSCDLKLTTCSWAGPAATRPRVRVDRADAGAEEPAGPTHAQVAVPY